MYVLCSGILDTACSALLCKDESIGTCSENYFETLFLLLMALRNNLNNNFVTSLITYSRLSKIIV